VGKLSLFLGIAGAALGISDYLLWLPGWIDLDATGRLFVASVVCSIVAAFTGCAGISGCLDPLLRPRGPEDHDKRSARYAMPIG
jgi:uncharacterized membrane protein YtjA (UPF0391 family)